MFKYQWIQFCRNTSLHGWKFTVLHKTTKWERFAWLAICLSALMVAAFLVSTAWFEYQLNPIITVTESTQYPIYKVVFPAITICSLNGISKKRAYKMANDLEKSNEITTESLASKMTLLFQLANNDNQKVPKENYKELQKILDHNKRTSEEVFRLVAPTCNSLLKDCIWRGKIVICESIFEVIKTSIGFCCSFNYFALRNRSFTGTFPNKAPKKPRRVSACGYQSGLEVLIDNAPNDYFATHIPSIGIRVLLHYPYDFPDWAVQNILCDVNTNNFVGINPTIITASKHVRKLPVYQRKCLFSDERYLINFEVYSFHNCMVECKMTLAWAHCSCIPFYHYNEPGSKEFNKICSLEDIPCLAEHEYLMYNESYLTDFNKKNSETCNCLPNCEGTFYMSKASYGTLDTTYSTNQFNKHSESLENHTMVRIFFDDLVATRHRKDSVFTWHTLMGYYGGIMGLLTGFSFISLFEMFYFTIIKSARDFTSKKTRAI